MEKTSRGLCIMMASHIPFGQKPDFVYLIGDTVYVEEFDTFMDAGLQDSYRIIPIGDYPPSDENSDAHDAYEYFYETCEYGASAFENERRQKYFSDLWEFLTGDVVIFK